MTSAGEFLTLSSSRDHMAQTVRQQFEYRHSLRRMTPQSEAANRVLGIVPASPILNGGQV